MTMQTKSYRLLLVDSRVMFRQGLRALLRRFQDLVVVGEAADGLAAIDLAREARPDVVLIDIHASGADILRAMVDLRREVPEANVVVLTVDDEDSGFVLQAIRAGARGCISQDSEIEDLVKAIRLVAQGQAVLAPQSLTSLIDFITQPDSAVEAPRDVDRLTAREREVLDIVAQGVTNREVAERLCVTESTVRSHMHSILDKLQLSNRVQAATFALLARQAEREDAVHFQPQTTRIECRV